MLTTTPTPLLEIQHDRVRLVVKDESVHPSGTFKHRLVQEAIASSSPDTVLATISYGNTAYSLARVLEDDPAAQGREAVVFMPAPRPGRRLGPDDAGRSVTEADLHRRLRRTLTVLPLPPEILDDGAITRLTRETLGRPEVPVENITEGLDHPTYVRIVEEACSQLGRTPDVCLVPFGAGILCNEARDFFAGSGCEVVALSVSRSDSTAAMLYGPVWVPVDVLARDGVALSRHRSPDRTGALREPYPVFDVTEDEVRAGLAFAAEHGISAEPSGAVGFGVLPRLDRLVPGLSRTERPTVLVISTGNALRPLAAGI